MKCNVCGENIPDNVEYCPNCGCAVDRTFEQEIIEPSRDDDYDNNYDSVDETMNASNDTETVDDSGFSADTEHHESYERHDRGRYCFNCGAPLTEADTFCPRCGARQDHPGEYRNKRDARFGEAYKFYWKNYVDFHSRSSIKEFWYVALWNFLIALVLGAIFVAVFVIHLTTIGGGDYGEGSLIVLADLAIFYIIYGLWALVNLIPTLSLAVRRLHDTGKSGLWLLLGLIPLGAIVLLIFFVESSEPGRNQYGD